VRQNEEGQTVSETFLSWLTSFFYFASFMAVTGSLFRHLEGLAYSYYQRTRTGDIMARATNDLNAVRMLLLGNAPSQLELVRTVAGAFGWVAGILIVFIPLAVYLYRRTS